MNGSGLSTQSCDIPESLQYVYTSWSNGTHTEKYNGIWHGDIFSMNDRSLKLMGLMDDGLGI